METHTRYFGHWLVWSLLFAIGWFVTFGVLLNPLDGSLVPFLYTMPLIASSITSGFLLFRTVHDMIQHETTHGEPGPNV